jgi:hypothetical protein
MEELNINEADYINTLENWTRFENYTAYRNAFKKRSEFDDDNIPSIKLKESDGHIDINSPGFCYLDQMRYNAEKKKKSLAN